ncbi:MAG: 1-(5-phosphoribosyl)-5-[(5-phosphoribosylamino)methylideneamino]imidazole-4-carboxamide isomerase [Eubacteriaceae bacterium]|jgi:phosphoribosylformimino-5-aminoimidazole carboxamide ribotide isomerase|nr:1-(5-phosphoribosyl)-5-[(5-phosphoribosylamino)methylideneamino]imidazole-4-carboxamide isomerase [Eubacteriaceae bacterium]
MKIFPAIDLIDGKAVRLVKGDYDQKTVYNDDPVSVAGGFRDAGARYLHLVDLDGAKDGVLKNFTTIKAIVESTDMYVEVGGGIRDEECIMQYLDAGVGRVILGSAAVEDRDFLEAMVQKYGGRIAVGVDAKDGKVAIHGWKTVTDEDSFEFCRYLESIGVEAVIYTDIAKDGGLGGTNIAAYKKLREICGLKITASGGISFESEITELKDITYAAILGKALYSGSLDLAKAIELSGEKQ